LSHDCFIGGSCLDCDLFVVSPLTIAADGLGNTSY
jgi:hypothetical protein